MEIEKVNPFESLLDSVEGSSNDVAKELFTATPLDIDFKTDIVSPEDVFVSSLCWCDSILNECGISPIYDFFLNNLLFLRVSLGRKSRQEFVDVNTRKMSNIQVPAEFSKIEDSRK